MTARGLTRAGAVALAAALALGACAPAGAPEAAAATTAATAAGELRLSFEDMLAPGAFDWSGPAAVVGADGAGGLWAVLPDVQRAERARVRLAGSDRFVDVALFRGRAGPGGAARLSAEAGAALGVEGRAEVRITALRREPRLAGKPAPAPQKQAPPSSPADLIGRLF